MDKRIALLFNVAAVVLFVSSGVVIIQQWTPNYILAKDKNFLNTAGSIVIINGFVYLIEIFVILRNWDYKIIDKILIFWTEFFVMDL